MFKSRAELKSRIRGSHAKAAVNWAKRYVVETDARMKQGSRVLKVTFYTLLTKLVDYSIVKAALVEVLGESLKVVLI